MMPATTFHGIFCRLTCAVLCLTGMAANARYATAQDQPVPDAIAQAAAELAKQLEPALTKRDFKVIAVGGFSAAQSVRGSGGPEIQTRLAAALQKFGFTINDQDYQAEVSGQYLSVEENNRQGVKIIARVVDTNGTSLGEFTHFLFGVEAVPRLLGLSVSIPPLADDNARSNAFKDAQRNPPPKPQGARIVAREGSPLAIEVLVKRGDKYEPVIPGVKQRGLPFVELNDRDLYAIRLINDGNEEVAAVVSIDGISVFEFSELNPRPQYWLVPAKSHIDIPGWHKNEQKVVEFKKVDDFSLTAAANLKLRPNEQIGLIHVCYNQCSETPFKGSRGTGFGKDVELASKKVDRYIGNPVDQISVRYER